MRRGALLRTLVRVDPTLEERSWRHRSLGSEPDAGRRGFDTVVIGAGQAGLRSATTSKQQAGLRDPRRQRADRRRLAQRWDSLRLFTPARYDGLPGMPFPAPAQSFPTQDEMADYLEAYAARFELPVRTASASTRFRRRGDRYVVDGGRPALRADNVVVATAHGKPHEPGLRRRARPSIVQLHSSDYRNPAQLAARPRPPRRRRHSGA